MRPCEQHDDGKCVLLLPQAEVTARKRAEMVLQAAEQERAGRGVTVTANDNVRSRKVGAENICFLSVLVCRTFVV